MLAGGPEVAPSGADDSGQSGAGRQAIAAHVEIGAVLEHFQQGPSD